METSQDNNESYDPSDRLSDLPDNVVHHILSFLLIKDVIRTSFLSRRWRYIWTSIPNLEFDGLVFSPKTKFMNFVDSVILRRSDLAIQKFSLRFGGYYCDISHIHTWILVASNRNVSELSLSSHTGEPFDLPPCIFTCRSLIVLKLNLHNSNFTLPSSIHLPYLKTLQLTSVSFLEENLNKIFCNCPMIEDLVIEDCFVHNLSCLHISSLSLKRLVIDGLPKDLSFYFPLLSYEIRVSAPRLSTLEYTDSTVKNISFNDVPSLVDVAMDLKFHLSKGEEKFGCHVLEFLRSISHMKDLTLSASTIQLLSVSSNLLRQFPTFSKLSRLRLCTAVNKNTIRVLLFLIHNSPKLEFLFLEFFLRRHWIDEEESSEPQNAAFECIVDHLKAVKIKGFGGTENEVVLIKHLLENARILEKMAITFSKQFSVNSKLSTEMRNDILNNRRSSTSTVVFCETSI